MAEPAAKRFRFSTWLIRALGIVVPRRLRADWRQEWEAELAHREELLSQWELLDRRRKANLLRRSLGAFWDVLWLQPQRLEDDFVSDLRFGVRVLLKNPGFSIIAILTLALGIGANTAIFSIVDGVMLRPLPYREADRLVTLWERHPLKGIEQENVSPPDFADWSARQRVFEGLAFWTGPSDFNLVMTDGTEKVRACYASSQLFPILGVNPVLGRTFLAEEDRPEGNRVAMIGYEFWQRRYGGDANVLGTTLAVDTFGRRDYTIVGVLPAGFRFPDNSEVWLPAGWNGLPRDRRGGHWLTVLARLKPGVSIGAAQAEMNLIQGGIAEQFGNVVIGTQVAIVPLLDQTLGFRLRSALIALLAIVVCVLLIACANVANLSLARVAARQKEMAVRLAIGASRLRLARQMITESLMLALVGGAVGSLLAVLIVRLIIFFNAGHIPRLQEVRVDGRVLLFTFLVSLLTGVSAGLGPAWQFSKPDLNTTIKGAGSLGGLNRGRLRSALVITQIALALVLLVGAGLMTRSFVRLLRLDRGFEVSRLLTAQLDFSVHGFTTWVQPTATRPQVTLKELISRLKNQPGVQSVGAAGGLPGGPGIARGLTMAIENRPPQAVGSQISASFTGVTPDYFRAMGISILKGRAFTDADTLEGKSVAIINEAMAKRHFPNEDPLGKRLAMFGRNPGELANNPMSTSPWIEIVGVVRDVKRLNLEGAQAPDVFRSYWQWPMQTPTLVVRTDRDSTSMAAAIRSELRALSPSVPQPRVRAMDEVVADIIAQPRFYTVLAALFGIMALLLAGIGIYGVVAYSVVQRNHELGIRIALGALPTDVIRLVIGNGLKLTLAGVLIGLASAAMLTRLLGSLLFGVSTSDPLTFALSVAILILASILACLVPARRAVRADPLEALRHE